MNSVIKWLLITSTFLVLISLLPGCGAQKAARSLSGKPQVYIYYLGADTSRLDNDEAETFNKLVKEMIDGLVGGINTWGFEATLLETQVGTFNYDDRGYMLRFSLTPHRLVSDTALSLMGKMAGPNIVEDHFEFIDLKSKQMITWGEYTRDLDQPMEIILKRKNTIALMKMDSFIHR
jgi:hypothetical protein